MRLFRQFWLDCVEAGVIVGLLLGAWCAGVERAEIRADARAARQEVANRLKAAGLLEQVEDQELAEREDAYRPGAWGAGAMCELPAPPSPPRRFVCR